MSPRAKCEQYKILLQSIGGHLGFDQRLPAWPGCAFLLLIRSPSDSAESFLARDAFWAAMLGRR